MLTPLILAVEFLTRLPLGGHKIWAADAMAQAPRWFAFVGLGLGLLGAALLWALAQLLPQALAVLLTVAALVAITGGLHEDGLADSLDALGGRDATHGLEIMRDSRIGSFGALGLGLVLAIQVTALAGMPLAAACAGLILSQTFGRGAMTVALAQGQYLRAKGAGAGMDQPLGAGGMFVVVLASVGAWMVAQGLGLGYGAVATGFAVGLVCAMLWRAAYLHRYEGDTGDLLGALHMVTATGVLLGVAAWP